MKTKQPPFISSVALILLASAFGATAVTSTNTVPGSANPWLAGMPDGSSASCGDFAPAQSPVQITRLPLAPGDLLSFSATGAITIGGGYPLTPPEGSTITIRNPAHDFGSENGLPDCRAPYDSLLGVFLGPDQPDSSPVPAPLDFSTTAARNYVTLQPALKKIFYIGDGLTTNGSMQNVVVPAGATRLFLGTMDGCGWYDNSGSFSVSVTETAPPAYLEIKLYPGLTIYGNVGHTSQIEYVSNFGATNWTVLTNLVLTTSPLLFIDANAPFSSQRFYRNVELP